MIPKKYEMVSLRGIDLKDSSGLILEGIYDEIMTARELCNAIAIYNWKLGGIVIPPTFVTIEDEEDNSITINDIINITDEDVVTIILTPAPIEPILVDLLATENRTYLPEEGVDGFSSVVVDVPEPVPDIITGRSVPTSDIGTDGNIYKQVIPIPDDIRFVDYLESDGNQYIDTTIIATQEFSFQIKTKCLGNYHGPFGARDSADGSQQFIVVGRSGGFRVGWGAFTNISASVGSVYEIEAKDGLVTVDDVNLARLNSLIFTTPSTLVLFGNHNGQTLNKGISSIYRLTIYQNGVPIADYLPCLDANNVICMWDNIAEEYAYNDGTGDFAYGEVLESKPNMLEPVYYVKTNGSWNIIGGN